MSMGDKAVQHKARTAILSDLVSRDDERSEVKPEVFCTGFVFLQGVIDNKLDCSNLG